MSKSLYLINPKCQFPTYFGAEVMEHWGLTPLQGTADLATTTTAALVPPDWQVTICEEHAEPIDFESEADFIGITAKVGQEKRMMAIADAFRRRGKTVIVGGPFASLAPELSRDHCDVLIVGELEGIAKELFTDLDRGNWKDEYRGEDRPDLALSPVPRWDLYNNDRALMGAVQTSRGCPFECEFCDVIQYVGRKQRHKSVEQVLAELDRLYEIGYRSVFLADDNLTVYRKRTKVLLAAIRDWNMSRKEGAVAFGTQLSIDAARDPEVMSLLGESGMIWVFIGIETPNVESLKETKKRQNVGIDLIGEVNVFLDHGISVIGGMIVGFDNDGLDIFESQFEFAMKSPIPNFSLGALVAPHSTPLYERMMQSDRLVETSANYSPWETNMEFSQISREELSQGMHWLCNQLYQPENFGRRMVQMIEKLGPLRGPFGRQAGKTGARGARFPELEAVKMLKKFVRQGQKERKMWIRIAEAMAEKPGSETAVISALYRYAQARCLYEKGQFWEPHPSDARPFETAVAASSTSSSGNGLVTLGG